jgi:hypothetical protein
MMDRSKIQRVRDKFHCDIVIHCTSHICVKYGNNDGDVILENPIVYDRFVDGVLKKTQLTTICCVTGELYDQDERKIKYSKLPWRILKELHRRVVQRKEFTFKPEYV